MSVVRISSGPKEGGCSRTFPEAPRTGIVPKLSFPIAPPEVAATVNRWFGVLGPMTEVK